MQLNKYTTTRIQLAIDWQKEHRGYIEQLFDI